MKWRDLKRTVLRGGKKKINTKRLQPADYIRTTLKMTKLQRWRTDSILVARRQEECYKGY